MTAPPDSLTGAVRPMTIGAIDRKLRGCALALSGTIDDAFRERVLTDADRLLDFRLILVKRANGR